MPVWLEESRKPADRRRDGGAFCRPADRSGPGGSWRKPDEQDGDEDCEEGERHPRRLACFCPPPAATPPQFERCRGGRRGGGADATLEDRRHRKPDDDRGGDREERSFRPDIKIENLTVRTIASTLMASPEYRKASQVLCRATLAKTGEHREDCAAADRKDRPRDGSYAVREPASRGRPEVPDDSLFGEGRRCRCDGTGQPRTCG